MSDSLIQHLPGDIAVVKTPPHLDAVAARRFQKTLDDLVSKKKFRIVIDLSGTTYLGSVGMGALVSHIVDTRRNKGDIRLAGACPAVREPLAVTNVDKTLKCYETVESAIESFAP